ncbi:DNA polymerase III subunit gamma/tau [Dehalogenimonas sp. 4OHTPN]|uniref:DNA polymerase III subunit gamma/tau n=1 Tax=Dehalogenimonas sp. 4OHTPN TaxID=3166643 RepID=A0AAU8GAX4_9CHLR
MSCQVYYRKWRPQRLSEVVGQEPITRTLLSALNQRRLAQAYLFCGPRGTGKTSTGRILAKAVNCLSNEGAGEPCNTCAMCRAITDGRALDVVEIDAASNTGVDDIRELKERVNYAPAEARFKVYIIDEVHMLSTSASNALLKTLEEPPPRVIFILATTELHKILPTIMSRCQRFDFRRLSNDDIAGKLSEVAAAEGIDISESAVAMLARAGGGALRDAENLLQQVATVCDGHIGLKDVQSSLGLTSDDRSGKLLAAIATGDAAAGLRLLYGVAADGIDLKQFNRELVERLRQLLMVKAGSADAAGLSVDELAETQALASATTIEQILRALKGFSALSAGTDMGTPLAMEMALVDATIKPSPAEKIVEVKPGRAEPAQVPIRKVEPAAKPAEVTSPPPVPVSPLIIQPKDSQPAPGAKEQMVDEVPPPVNEPKLAGAPVTTLGELQDQWPQILTQAPPRLRRSTALAILRSADIVQPVSFNNGTITLSFKFAVHMNKINEPENKKITAEILSACVGAPCQIACVFDQVSNHLVKEAQKRGAEIIKVEDKWISQK